MVETADLTLLNSLDIHRGTKVLLRADLNVPMSDGEISDDMRIRSVVPTIEYLLDRGASVIAMSHLGRPKGAPRPELSLAPVASRLGELIGRCVDLLPDAVGPDVKRRCAELAPGDVVLLENLRFDPGETANDSDFARELAALGDVYVNDAFGSSHRSHASVDALARLRPGAAGLLLEAEVKALGRLLGDPPRPFVAILGGAKASDKLGVIDALLDKVDALLIGGAMAFTFALAAGGKVGDSLVEPDRVDDAAAAVAKAHRLGKELLLPSSVVIAREIALNAEHMVVDPMSIPAGWMGLDIGPDTASAYARRVADASSVFWNGPMGVFETPPFDAGTRSVASAVASAEGFTVVGGGDSVAAIREMGFADAIDHLSTGGGASLELIERGDLVGLAALRGAV